MHTITGTVTVTDFSAEALDGIAEANGYPVLTTSPYDKSGILQARLNFLNAVQAGQTFDCSTGLGGGYADLAAGGGVTVADGSGQVIATANLGKGVLDATGCHLSYTVSVPDATFYAVTVTHRGSVTYSEAQLEAANWTITTKIA